MSHHAGPSARNLHAVTAALAALGFVELHAGTYHHLSRRVAVQRRAGGLLWAVTTVTAEGESSRYVLAWSRLAQLVSAVVAALNP